MLPSKRSYVYAGFILLAFALVAFINYHTSYHYIESDSASEMILARHLSETNRILSRDWGYSTELRILDTQLVFAPLFKIFDSYRMVRFAGAIILTGILWLSYFYLSRQLKMTPNTFLVSSAILILPTTAMYARFVLFHSYYVPHIAISFFIVGLFISICNEKNTRAIFRYVKIVSFLILCFLSGLESIRQILIAVAPLCLVVLIMLHKSANAQPGEAGIRGYLAKFWSVARGAQRTAVYPAAAALAVSLLGYLINSRVLSDIYSFRDYNQLGLRLLDANFITGLLNGILMSFGYVPDVQAISLSGIFSLMGIAVFVAIAFLTVVSGRRAACTAGSPTANKSDSGLTDSVSLMHYFLLSTFIINVLVFLLTRNYDIRYYIPVLVYLIPMLAMLFDAGRDERSPGAGFQNLTISLIAVAMAANSFVSAYYIIRQPGSVNPPYLRQEVDPGKIGGAVNFLRHEQYGYGFATFWNSNIMTEISNDAIRTSTVTESFSSYYEWLSLRYYRDEGYFTGKAFVLFSSGEMERIRPEEHHFYSNGIIVYSDEHFTVLHFDDVSEIQRFLESD